MLVFKCIFMLAHESTPWGLLVLFMKMLYKQRNLYLWVDSFTLSLKVEI
jgi:hypothetical protein